MHHREDCLKRREDNVLFGEFSKVGKLGCFCPILGACKSFARHNDEKCGRYVTFQLFTQPFLIESRIPSFPLSTAIQGSSFQQHLYPQMVEFLNKSVIEDEKLSKSVYADVKVSFYVAVLKALGLISKMIKTTYQLEKLHNITCSFRNILHMSIRM